MEEARAVLARLGRIEAFERAGVAPARILAEVRCLLTEAEAWARLEPSERGEKAVAEIRAALAREEAPVSIGA